MAGTARTLQCRIKGYIQPFERILALKELEALSGDRKITQAGRDKSTSCFQVKSAVSPEVLAKSLAYWEEVQSKSTIFTHQLHLEATSLVARNGVSIDDLPRAIETSIQAKRPAKRCLRYATHGIHEYRGKFFPQLVRALINVAEVPSNGLILDPMCGSGTTLVEGALSGRETLGLDFNPLSVFVTEVKCALLRESADELIESYKDLCRRIERGRTPKALAHVESLAVKDRDYLVRWFRTQSLRELEKVRAAISQTENETHRAFFLVVLSNILRAVSLQKEDDLRVRREERTLESGEVSARYLAEANRVTKLVAAFLWQNRGHSIGRFDVREGDARCSSSIWKRAKGRADAIISSPPYATALPYIDTDRLSLIYLGLLGREEHREHDLGMIGNREVTERWRQTYWDEFLEKSDTLPAEIVKLIKLIERRNRNGDAGFRRRNLPALLAKYFLDMRLVIEQHHDMLRRHGMLYLVVGNNSTVADGKRIEIATAQYLSQIAEIVGFKVHSRIEMDMLKSRDIFRKNALKSEEILILEKT